MIRPSQANAVRVLRALSQFGFGSLDISASDLTSSGKVIQLGYEPNRIDLMTSVTGVSFDDAWDDRAPGDLDGLPVNFIGRSSLLRNKDATGRASTPRNFGSRNRQLSLHPWMAAMLGVIRRCSAPKRAVQLRVFLSKRFRADDLRNGKFPPDWPQE